MAAHARQAAAAWPDRELAVPVRERPRPTGVPPARPPLRTVPVGRVAEARSAEQARAHELPDPTTIAGWSLALAAGLALWIAALYLFLQLLTGSF
jgi:hypothetical protein